MRSLRGFDTALFNDGLINGTVSNAEAWPVRRALHAVDELDAGPRVLGEQQVAVEVDVIHQARDVRAGCDAETGLDHAAEHHAEPERTSGVGHAHRLADAARLCKLDVDAVRAFRARADVGERVAVLVDVDRDVRALLQRRAVRVAGLQRLLAVL